MTKKTFISTLLLLVFSFVLVHNIIPHHHHDESSEIYNHEHKHHHDKKEKDHHDENDEPVSPFSHAAHSLASSEFRIIYSQSFQETQYVSNFFLISDLIFKPTTNPVKLKPPDYISAIPLQHFCSAYSLRGPPVS